MLCEDMECGVCYLPYSRVERVPRVLHCRHTFCALCLSSMAQSKSGLLTVRCPLCRQMTCVGRGLGLQEALWVDTKVWDQIPESEEDQEVEEEDREIRPALQVECPAAQQSRPKLKRLKIPAFLKKLNFLKHPQERTVPKCNVEIKSWRRVPGAEVF
ncbi:uncharacterized protein [Lepisosteus oculatus]|uniref:uncharacterized protein isoform X1 n=2 Tax=Lepisosteus oculatus TaxID=7918 RepID=UPI0035F52B6C